METFVQLTVTGLANGAVLALAALGFVIIFKSTGVINFAQGEFLLVGAYAVFAGITTLGLSWPLAVAVAAGIGCLAGLATERLILRPMVGQSVIAVMMVTIGLAFVIRGAVQLVFGNNSQRMPVFIPTGSVEVAGTSLGVAGLWAIGIASVVIAAVTLFFARSRHGIAMRAVADDQQAALTVGISVRRVFAMSWALAAATAVAGGVLVANIVGVSPDISAFGLVVFPVVILGGLDSIGGTIVGGFALGLVIQYTSGYVGNGLQEVVPFLVLLLIMMIRPYGLFGQARIERV